MSLFDPLFAWVMAASLRASLLAAVVFALQRVVGHRLSARWRYTLWLPMILVVVLPVLPASPWSLENRFTGFSTDLPPSAIQPLHARFAEFITHLSAVSSMASRCPLIVGGWFFVTVMLMVAAGIGYQRRLARLRQGDAVIRPELWSDIVAEARRIRLRRLPRVIVSEAVESPAVTGLFRSVLLLPKGFPAGLTRTEARLILLHELTHLQRLDLLLNWFLCVLQALHWFNPLLWLAFSRLRADREAACDARVLSAHEVDLRAEYAHALLKLHQDASVSDLSLAFGGHLAPGALRGRLLSITRHGRVHYFWSAVGAVMVAGLILTGATRAPSNERLTSTAETKGQVGDGERPTRVANAPVDLLPFVGNNAPGASTSVAPGTFAGRGDLTRTNALSNQRGHRLYRIGYLLETLFRQTISRGSEASPGDDLPDWWPRANSVRILLNSTPRVRRSVPWKANHRFA